MLREEQCCKNNSHRKNVCPSPSKAYGNSLRIVHVRFTCQQAQDSGPPPSTSTNMESFNWFEYTVFFGMLVASVLIGVFYAYRSNKRKETTDDYMFGGRNMPILPTAMSLIVSFVSGVTILGFPAETYIYGTQVLAMASSVIISTILLNIFYLPVFYNLQHKSLFEYLERRFNKRARTMASFIYTLALLLKIPVVIYVPSLAFNQVTGIPITILAPVISFICIFYTAIGGLKAVVWSDALQIVFTIASIIAVIVIGCIGVGGIGAVFKASEEGERLELFNFDPDPTQRSTFWTITLGGIPIYVNFFATYPSSVQRYISLPTYSSARKVSVIMCSGIVMMKFLGVFTGLIIYTKYRDCDPTITKQVNKPGQILPMLVKEVAKDYPGLSGLFLSGVVSSALSTMSTGLNNVAGTIFEDFLSPFLPASIKEERESVILKLTVVFFGVLCTLIIFVIKELGTVLEIALGLQGVTAGVLLSMFTFGLTVRSGNTKGVLSGAVVGLITTGVLAIGANLYILAGDIVYGRKVTTIEACPENMTLPLNLNTTRFGYPGEGTRVLFSERVPWVFRLSYLYYSVIGLAVSMAVASLVSIATRTADGTTVAPELLIPQLRGERIREHIPIDEYSKVPTVEEGQRVLLRQKSYQD